MTKISNYVNGMKNLIVVSLVHELTSTVENDI